MQRLLLVAAVPDHADVDDHRRTGAYRQLKRELIKGARWCQLRKGKATAATTRSTALSSSAGSNCATIHLPQSDGSIKALDMKAQPIGPVSAPLVFNRTVYGAAGHAGPLGRITRRRWGRHAALSRAPVQALGFKVAEAMDTAQRGMGVDWPVARELIRRSLRHAKAVGGGWPAAWVPTSWPSCWPTRSWQPCA
jgi:hypothetical protein